MKSWTQILAIALAIFGTFSLGVEGAHAAQSPTQTLNNVLGSGWQNLSQTQIQNKLYQYAKNNKGKNVNSVLAALNSFTGGGSSGGKFSSSQLQSFLQYLGAGVLVGGSSSQYTSLFQTPTQLTTTQVSGANQAALSYASSASGLTGAQKSNVQTNTTTITADTSFTATI